MELISDKICLLNDINALRRIRWKDWKEYFNEISYDFNKEKIINRDKFN